MICDLEIFSVAKQVFDIDKREKSKHSEFFKNVSVKGICENYSENYQTIFSQCSL